MAPQISQWRAMPCFQYQSNELRQFWWRVLVLCWFICRCARCYHQNASCKVILQQACMTVDSQPRLPSLQHLNSPASLLTLLTAARYANVDLHQTSLTFARAKLHTLQMAFP